uniref:J domain-containing protein n=1 Tax=Kalanchoe fedtschenkoi TaxID=63787 RepID=A0A7N0RA47_KALFE
MESKKEEALRAKENAERLFLERNLVAAKRYALKAQSLCPGLDGVSQMVDTFNIYLASEARVNGEIDYYSILGLKPTADDGKVKKQYKKMAVLLHPDKNKCVGADGAFKLVSEAWTVLSDRAKRSAYDIRRKKQLPAHSNPTNSSSVHGNGVVHFDHSYAAPVPHHRLDTFWTVCTSCKVQYEYLRKYLNKKLSCKNCRGVFMAVETGLGPVNASYPFHTWSSMPTNGYASNGVNGVSYYPSNSVLYTGNGVHIGHGSEYPSNLAFQWSSSSKTSSGVVIHNGSSTVSADAAYNTNEKVNVKSKEKRKLSDRDENVMKTGSVQMASNPSTTYRNPLLTKAGKIDKRRRVDSVAVLKSLFEDTGSSVPCEVKLPNATGGATANHTLKPYISNEQHARRFLTAPLLDVRKILADKAKSDIQKKLEEMTSAVDAAAAAEKSVAQQSENVKSLELDTKSEPISINVPDPDFHDFDKDRTEQCFRAKQIWALYDEEDGMPRLYCMIRQVLSLDPFMMHITYLSSKSSTEFGSVNWVGAGFTKSCGRFKAMHSDTVDKVNIFSHVLSDEIKAGRGGCVRIYPKKGDIWAIYRNWSPDWDSSTPEDVRRQYDMVEVVADYTEERGVPISPLVKLEGYNTVYRRSADKNAICWVLKQEMFCFSHQVPSWPLEGDAYGLPDGCWDLDPAATPDDLLHSAKRPHATDEPKTNLVQGKLGLHYVNEQAAESSMPVSEPTSQEDRFHTKGNQYKDSFANAKTAIEELNPHPEVDQDQLQNTNEHAAAEPQANQDVKLHEIDFADEQVAVQKEKIHCSAGYGVAGAEPNPDLNQNIQLQYLDECDANVEPKLDLEVKQNNQLHLPNGQAAAEGLESYLQVKDIQGHYAAGNAVTEPNFNPVVKQNHYFYDSELTDQATRHYPPPEKQDECHGRNQHGAAVFRQDNFFPAVPPKPADEQPQLSEAEQIELLFRF